MKKPNIFIACDTTNLTKVRKDFEELLKLVEVEPLKVKRGR